jgi:hypothetical protein
MSCLEQLTHWGRDVIIKKHQLKILQQQQQREEVERLYSSVVKECDELKELVRTPFYHLTSSLLSFTFYNDIHEFTCVSIQRSRDHSTFSQIPSLTSATRETARALQGDHSLLHIFWLLFK